MALFGGQPKRKFGLFGETEQYGTPPYVPDQITESAPPSLAMRPEKKGGGFFADGGIGRAIAGTLGDALLQHSGGRAVYAPAMMQRREMLMAKQLAESDRAAKMADWKAQFDYERANPKPSNNDTISDFNWYKGLAPQDQAIYDRLHPVTVMGPDGPYVVPRSAIGAQQGPQASTVPTAPVGKLTPIGGPSQPATGGFRY